METAVAIQLQPWEVLRDAIMQMPYGTRIEHKEISNIIGIPYGEGAYRSTIHKVKEELLHMRRVIKNIHKFGYVIVNPDEYTDLAIIHYNKGARQLKRAFDVIEYAPIELMSPSARQAYNLVSDHTRRIQARLEGGVVEVRRLNRPRRVLEVVQNG